MRHALFDVAPYAKALAEIKVVNRAVCHLHELPTHGLTLLRIKYAVRAVHHPSRATKRVSQVLKNLDA